MKLIVSFFSGVIFAIGLGISQMTIPTKVINFLDITGNWDPSLAFVMIGAIGVHFIAYQIKNKMTKPKYAASFDIPTINQVNPRLLIGALLFGAGWGLGGFCPGPAIVSMVSTLSQPLIFGASMFLGFAIYSIALAPKTSVSPSNS